MQISPSDLVHVRQAPWRVVDIRAYERCQVLTLAGVGPANNGLERRVIAPFDVIEPVQRRSRMTPISRRLWRRACRALIAADIPPGSLSCARSARIDLLPHQLEPALALLRGLGSRALLADDVGLGKTIQAGLIVSELRAHGAADRILIITPAGLRDQWAGELSTRFGIDAAVLDARALRKASAMLPIGVNPWQTVPLAIASVDYIKRAEVLAAASACHFDLVIVDEAHGVAGLSDRHAAVAALAERSSCVVLLTATPHNGDRRTFASLCGIGGVPGDRLLVFRRSRHDIQLGARRRVHQLHVRLSRDETRMHALLERFSQAIRAQHGHAGSGEDYWIALSVLHKRALSSARSLQHSIGRRLAAHGPTVEQNASQLQLPLDDREGELTSADDAPPWSPLLTLRDEGYERRLLRALAAAAASASRHETKIAALARLLRRIDEPAIVFTEYRDTLMHVQTSLDMPSVVLHGGMARDDRLATVDRFTRGGERLLLATDAAGEGLNLQQTCRLVINLELPWNPMRLEQRIGRVDRIGQSRPVHVFHLIARDSNESRILNRLRARVAAVRAEIGGTDPLSNDVAMARLIITDEAPATSSVERLDEGQPVHALCTPSLMHDAVVEARRIAAARTFLKIGDERALAHLEGFAPFMTNARHWRTRARLRGRTVMVWRITAADGNGRPAGSTVVAIAASRWTAHDDENIRGLVEQATGEWRERMLARHRAFVDARLAREQAMAPPGIPTSPAVSAGLFQPGLFEHRDARARLAMMAARTDAERDREQRIAALERASSLSFLPPQLLFVLTP